MGLLPRTRHALPGYGWAVYLSVTGLVGLAYLLLKGTYLHSGPVFNLIGLSSIVAILATVRSSRARMSWLLIAAGLTTFVAGDVLSYNYTRFFGTTLPFPSVADAVYLATGPLLIAGLLSLVRKRNPAHDRAALIDVLILTLSAGALSWTFLIAPYARDSTLSVPTKLTSIAYPLLDLAITACIARLALGQGRRSPALGLLTTGVLCLLATDSIYGWKLLHGGYTTGGLLDGGWIAFYALVGAAALHPRSRALVEKAPDTQFRLTRQRTAGLACCALITPAGTAIASMRSTPELDVVLLATCSGIVFLLVFARLLDLGRRYEAGLHRVTVLAEAGVRLAAARTGSEVDEVAAAAGSAMLADAQKADESVDADALEGMRALASAAALASEKIEMAEQLQRQRAEARLQTLVEHSSDAILVVDTNGRIDYASPSTMRMLGEQHGLAHRPFADLVAEKDRPRIAQLLLRDDGLGSTQTLEFALRSAGGEVEVEAACTNLLGNQDIGGIVFNIRDVSERKRFERELTHRAFHDELTGLANRALFQDRVAHALERVQRGSSIAVLFVDIDDFKTVNDTLGHKVGDRLIRTVADRITHSARDIDTAARLGGDDFAVLIEDDGDIDPVQIAKRILKTIRAPISVDGNEFRVTASIGIARANAGDVVSVDDLLAQRRPCHVLRQGQRQGHVSRSSNRTCTSALLSRLEAKRELQTRDRARRVRALLPTDRRPLDRSARLARGADPLEASDPRPRARPINSSPSQRRQGRSSPSASGCSTEACTEAAKLQSLAGMTAPTISVNISGRQLQDSELVADVLKALRQADLAPERLVLEITETVMITNVDLALSRLHKLSRHGVKLAVDDFGSGYSSLNYIRRFPIDILKIDRAFIADLAESS